MKPFKFEYNPILEKLDNIDHEICHCLNWHNSIENCKENKCSYCGKVRFKKEDN